MDSSASRNEGYIEISSSEWESEAMSSDSGQSSLSFGPETLTKEHNDFDTDTDNDNENEEDEEEEEEENSLTLHELVNWSILLPILIPLVSRYFGRFGKQNRKSYSVSPSKFGRTQCPPPSIIHFSHSLPPSTPPIPFHELNYNLIPPFQNSFRIN